MSKENQGSAKEYGGHIFEPCLSPDHHDNLPTNHFGPSNENGHAKEDSDNVHQTGSSNNIEPDTTRPWSLRGKSNFQKTKVILNHNIEKVYLSHKEYKRLKPDGIWLRENLHWDSFWHKSTEYEKWWYDKEGYLQTIDHNGIEMCWVD